MIKSPGSTQSPNAVEASHISKSNFEELKFEDGGVYCGGTVAGKAHGHGVCTGPGGDGQYSGSWEEGFEVSGSYMWPNGHIYYGLWEEGKMNGLGVVKRGRWTYQGEMTMGYMGKYGVKTQQGSSCRYEGTWNGGVQCGFGVEVYSDGGSYHGQWLKGLRQGYGTRRSAPFHQAAPSAAPGNLRRFSLSSARSEPELILKDSSEEPQPKSITDFFPAVASSHSDHHNHPPVIKKFPAVNRIGFFLKGEPYKQPDPRDEQKKYDEAMRLQEEEGEKAKSFEAFLAKLSITPNPADSLDFKSVPMAAVEVYSGEWKNDKRGGFGVCERSDGLKYEGEWLENCKNGPGVTTYPDGRREEGFYKKNVLQEPSKKIQQVLRPGKQREAIQSAVTSANKAAQIATQKAEIAVSRGKTAVSRREQTSVVSERAALDSKTAQCQLAAHIQQRTERAQKLVKNELVNDGEKENEEEKRRMERPKEDTGTRVHPTALARHSGHQTASKRQALHGSLLAIRDPALLPNPRTLADIHEESPSSAFTPLAHQTTTPQRPSKTSSTLTKPTSTLQANLAPNTAHKQHDPPPSSSSYPKNGTPKRPKGLSSKAFNVQSVPDVRVDGPAFKALQERNNAICGSLKEESRRMKQMRAEQRRGIRRIFGCFRDHFIITFFFVTIITAATSFFLFDIDPSLWL